ncbi:flagellar hook assembly protein FlgD [Devosia naphthalenivorans]|uniref:flagellar hook assembly protein FlgD n=1 Tax=Devosia naphthalenivorans TaxID=2082392 RepID=UPI000D3487A9|nr:flagellar hook capping FlgD N-terminal domain-containing protein [Devosia naphthalenivorans]
MAAIDNVSATGTSKVATSRATMADNFDTFLNILTTQLKNQNPLDPLDTNQFTAQLVQFTGVEQQLKTNEFLETLMLSTQNTAKSEAVSYIGKQVTASGKTGELNDEKKATWAFNAETTVPNAVVTIKDSKGSVVYSETGSLNAGPGTFLWDGKTTTGTTAPNGIYTIDIKGTSLSGSSIEVTTSSVGVVTGVDFTGDVPILTIGSRKVAISDVTDVRVPSTEEPAEEEPSEGDAA